MSFTATDLAAVEQAIASGEMMVQVAGKMVQYRTVKDLERARQIIKAELGATSSASSMRRGSYRVQFATARGD